MLADIPKNKSEIPRVGLSEFKGHNLAYARVFYEGEDGKYCRKKSDIQAVDAAGAIRGTAEDRGRGAQGRAADRQGGVTVG